ncbi:hypothetical protein M758_9G092600 [Ceratodon purpureus]|uniref:HMA domain-containing protein n=1 Tax=Ceratodon purpureus TaxID=3225 RepID=A0A8T0GUI8_CERPU|nr:hypothetical protein KC19_9G163800 [Ceratodon purpureus]KAG0605846.1 hypothetical protein M758_9G092600 [Ceratodon purpureus]
MASRIREMFSSSKEDPVYRVNYAQHQGMNSRSSYAYKQHHGPLPVIELKVPMCCNKCKEKVQEELEEMEGVKDVLCDQFNQRVTVTGYADPLRVLKRVKKVKKKSEFFTQGSYIQDRSTHVSSSRHDPSIHPSRSAIHREVKYTGQPLMHTTGHPGLARTNSFGRSLARQPSFGKVAHYDGGRHHDLENRDFQRDYYGVRRMPSFKKHRYHDAEYVSMGDEFTPQYGETHYVRQHHQRPMLQSQVSFSKLPVNNPYYVKPMYHEY